MSIELHVPNGYFDTTLEGVKIDFNYGFRASLPPNSKYHILVQDLDTHTILCDQDTEEERIETLKKYYIRYHIEITAPNGEKYIHDMNLEDKNVLIRFPLVVMGDILAWFPYALEFKKKHKCNLYVSVDKKLRPLFEPAYPDLIFVEDDEEPANVYATYFMGIFFPANDRNHQPIDFRVFPLWAAAPYILGLPPIEKTVKVAYPPTHEVKERYVCIAVQGTAYCKHWNNPVGWFRVVRYLKSLGYKVLCIDKEPIEGTFRCMTTIPHGAEDYTGNRPLTDRASMLAHADFFIGIGSGLSWLAHAVGIPVVMISGFSYPFAEFTNPYRVINYNVCTGCFNDSSIEYDHNDFEWCPRHKGTDREFECSKLIEAEQVIDTINLLIKNEGLHPPCEERIK